MRVTGRDRQRIPDLPWWCLCSGRTQASRTKWTTSPSIRKRCTTVVEQLPLTQPQDAARVYVRGGDQIIGKSLERIVIAGEDVTTVWAEVKAELEQTAALTVELLRQVEG